MAELQGVAVNDLRDLLSECLEGSQEERRDYKSGGARHRLCPSNAARRARMAFAHVRCM
jgi:hypothetical protein